MTNSDDTLRTFVGVPVSEAVRATVVRLQERLRDDLDGHQLIKWERPANLHLTLKFLGDTKSADLAPIAEALELVCADRRPFPLRFADPEVFGGKRPRVIVIGLAGGAGALRSLQADLSEALEVLGFPREQRPFRPHLTIGRVRRGRRVQRSAIVEAIDRTEDLIEDLSMEVGEVVHFRSELSPSGATHSRLATVELGS